MDVLYAARWWQKNIFRRTQDGPNITSDAQNLLNHFCEWQYSVNELDDSHPNHHDTAVLLTR